MKHTSALLSVFLVLTASFFEEEAQVNASSNNRNLLRREEKERKSVLVDLSETIPKSLGRSSSRRAEEDSIEFSQAASSINGEEACEGHGYNESECSDLGDKCCHYSALYYGGSCSSNIGQAICHDEPLDGKSACEGHGYDAILCSYVGTENKCCQFDEEKNECMSAIGADMCANYRPSDYYTDDGVGGGGGDEDESIEFSQAASSINGEEACEGHGYNDSECSDLGDKCCHYNALYYGKECSSQIGQTICHDEPLDGKSACEGHGYDAILCSYVGTENKCCQFDEEKNECMSAIGTDMCANYRPSDYTDDGVGGGDGGNGNGNEICNAPYELEVVNELFLLKYFACESSGDFLLEYEHDFTCSPFNATDFEEAQKACSNIDGKLYHIKASVVCDDEPGVISFLTNAPTCYTSCNAQIVAKRFDFESSVTKANCVFNALESIFVDGEEFSWIGVLASDGNESENGTTKSKSPKAPKAGKMAKAAKASKTSKAP